MLEQWKQKQHRKVGSAPDLRCTKSFWILQI